MRVAAVVALVAVLTCGSPGQGEVALGHRDFYPSAQRPVGWRGDGTGAWAGATPVGQWDGATGKNIVWKVAMPGPSFSQPVVVGDKVFTLADPNWLICLSASDGKILWQKQVDHTAAMPADLAAKAREADKFWLARFREYSVWLDVQSFPEAKGIGREEIDAANKAAEAYTFDVNHPGQANFSMIDNRGALWKQCLADQAKYSLYYFGHWEGILTHTFATPVSDGNSVFVSMSNDQVACYDLEGNCRWLIWDRPKAAKADEQHVRYAMSPLLIEDKLIVAACGEMRAYDKATGKKLWGVAHKTDFGARWVKVGSPVVMRMKVGGKPMDVILSPGSGIYRASDGKLVGALPDLAGYEGSTALVAGDMYIRKGAPDSGPRPRLGCRIVAKSEDEVMCEEVWKTAGKTTNTTDVLSDGFIYSPQSLLKIDVRDGKEAPLGGGRGRDPSPALGGKLLVLIGGGSYGPREKSQGTAGATVVSLDNPGTASTIATAFVDKRYLEDTEFRLRWRWRGNGGSMSNSSPAFQANRMFFRTVGYLWCVGDPNEAWQSPKECPAEGRVK